MTGKNFLFTLRSIRLAICSTGRQNAPAALPPPFPTVPLRSGRHSAPFNCLYGWFQASLSEDEGAPNATASGRNGIKLTGRNRENFKFPIDDLPYQYHMMPRDRDRRDDVAMTVDSGIRKELARFCRGKRTRKSAFSPTLPTHWSPYQVRNPHSEEAFTDEGAWLFIADLLESGHPVEVITLDKPPGKKGYVLKCAGVAQEQIYIKLQMGSGFVIGRSFHVSIANEKLQ